MNEKTDFYFWPEDLVDSNSKWRKLEDKEIVSQSGFQSGIKDGEKMVISVYINEAGNIIYIEAVGD